MPDEKERSVIRAMVSDSHERSRVVTVEEMPDDDSVSLVAADGSDPAQPAIVVFSLNSITARELGQALIEAADGIEASDV